MEMAPALISGAGALTNMFGNDKPPAPPPTWQPPGMTGAANNTLSMIGKGAGDNVPGQLMPQYQDIVGGLNNNPGAGNFMNGANLASMFGMGAANSAYGGGDYLTQLAHAIGVNAFDPQNALYGRTQQQLQEQTRASSEARGINSTPYGAGVENKAMGDFNIDWQNNMLQRMIAGGGAAGNLMNSGVNLQGAAPGMAYQAGQYPWQAFNTMGQNKLGNLDHLAQAGINAHTIPNQAIAQWLQYLGVGNQAGQVSNQQAQVAGQNQQMGFNQNQTIGNQFGQAFNSFNKAGGFPAVSNGVGNMFNSGSNSMGNSYTAAPQTGTGWGSNEF